jgi:hypothetical protein
MVSVWLYFNNAEWNTKIEVDHPRTVHKWLANKLVSYKDESNNTLYHPMSSVAAIRVQDHKTDA